MIQECRFPSPGMINIYSTALMNLFFPVQVPGALDVWQDLRLQPLRGRICEHCLLPSALLSDVCTFCIYFLHWCVAPAAAAVFTSS